MMKKTISVILAAIIILSTLVACNQSEGNAPITSSESLDADPTSPTDPYVTDEPATSDVTTTPNVTDTSEVPTTPVEPVVYERQLLSASSKISFNNMRIAVSKNNPVSFKQNVNDILEEKTVTRIGIPVIKISDPKKDAKTELHLITKALPAKIIETYPLVIPANTYSSETVNEWVYFDLDISIGEGQTIAFGSQDETIFWGYANSADEAASSAVRETRGCITNVNTSSSRHLTNSLLFDIYYEEIESEDDKNMTSLAGKYVSILGASISTFTGFSDSSLYNSTIVNNAQYYPKADFLNDVKYTWWMRMIKELDLKLCVNNSWSGSCVSTKVDGREKAACMDRATQLHNDNLGIEPDIIILIIGGNDVLRGYDIGTYNGVDDIYDKTAKKYIGNCTLFAPAYATMVHKVKERYPDADIYVCSMLHWDPANHNKSLVPYNDAIKKIADEFGVTYVDFYNGTNISPETKIQYFHTDYKHPNKAGFAQMADYIINLLKSRYN